MKVHPTDNLVRTLSRVDDASLAGFADRPGARRLMDDITAGPVPERRSRRRLPRLTLRIAAVGAVAAVTTAAVSLVMTDDEGRPRPAVPGIGSVAEAAVVLDHASAAAKSRPYTAPGPQQWLYTKFKMTAPAHPSGIATGGPYTTKSWELWRRVDGKNQYAAYENGKLGKSPATREAPLAARFDPLPTDPDALLRKIGGGNDLAFHTLGTILAESLHPPATEAAIFQAIKLIPHVTATAGVVDADGRPAVSLGLTDPAGWLRSEILLDPKTYRYLGERSITVQDHRVDGKVTVKRGTLQFIQVREAVGVVGEPGERP
ncbi:hypothetical protein F8568_016460 [Actinomadura sp. LD22]|uniref:CU044_5270 family protein n=1 Tax=Actinomadura physcomitrii TaxID=2650748 RepID=A0A6I4MI96_9ACTN|nr:CU044_5270 family protein [Actinomadura physcomitrii]MWA01936.1 hypothetical protein [Actinomadura physcomitrii]